MNTHTSEDGPITGSGAIQLDNIHLTKFESLITASLNDLRLPYCMILLTEFHVVSE